MDLTTATPVEIDTEIARLESDFATAQHRAEQAQDTINRINNVRGTYEEDYPWNSQEKFEEACDTLNAATNVQATIRERLYPLCAEYRRRPWNRYYLVTNAGGHVHSSMACDTCFPTTRYAWLTEQSGMTHDALVEMAGEQACTVCFPNAPVDVLKRKSRLETPDRKAAREERERKQAEKNAAQVEVVLYHYGHRIGNKVFKTARAATNDIASNLRDLCWYGTNHPSAEEWLSNVANVRTALQNKGVEYDFDKALAAARKAVKRDGMDVPKY